MHDFAHDALCEAEHVNDCAFMARRGLMSDLGGFDESYTFGWFDQLEMCRMLRAHGHPVYYDPGSVFSSTQRQPLVNRMLAERYVDFYRDEFLIREHFRIRQRRFLPSNLLRWLSPTLLLAGANSCGR